MTDVRTVGTIITECPACGHVHGFNAKAYGRWACVRCEACMEPFWIEVVSVGGVTRSHEDLVQNCLESPGDRARVDAIYAEVKAHGHGTDDDAE